MTYYGNTSQEVVLTFLNETQLLSVVNGFEVVLDNISVQHLPFTKISPLTVFVLETTTVKIETSKMFNSYESCSDQSRLLWYKSIENISSATQLPKKYVGSLCDVLPGMVAIDRKSIYPTYAYDEAANVLFYDKGNESEKFFCLDDQLYAKLLRIGEEKLLVHVKRKIQNKLKNLNV